MISMVIDGYNGYGCLTNDINGYQWLLMVIE